MSSKQYILFRNILARVSCQPAGGVGNLQVIAACFSVQVYQLSGKKESRYQLGFHGLRANFACGDPSGCNDRFLEGAGSCHGEGEAFHEVADAFPLPGRNLVPLFVRVNLKDIHEHRD